MIVIRLLAALLAACASMAAVLGFSVAASLTDSDRFVSAMDQAITRPIVQQEVEQVIRQEVMAASERLTQNAGPLGELARSGSEAVAGRLGQEVSSDGFRAAWTDWSRLLYEGLADNAAGLPNDQVFVSGSDITVGIEPLVAPVLGDAVAGGLTGTLEFLGRDTDVTIVASMPLQTVLSAAGTLSEWRWVALAAALLMALVAVLSGPSRMRWLGITLLLAAALTAGLAALVQATQDATPTGSQTPQLTQSVVTALTEPWQNALVAAAMVLTLVGAGALILSVTLRTAEA